jgi:hypothetical protein
LRQLSKRQLRDARDRVAALQQQAPPDRGRLLARAIDQREHAEQERTEAIATLAFVLTSAVPNEPRSLILSGVSP